MRTFLPFFLALPLGSAAPFQEQPAGIPAGLTEEQIELLETRNKDQLRLSVFEPQFSQAQELIPLVEQLTAETVSYYYISEGHFGRSTRDRFIPIIDAVGVQDFADGLEEADKLLSDLDKVIGARKEQQAMKEPSSFTATYQPKTMSAEDLVLAIQGQVRDLPIRANPRINSLGMEGDPSSIREDLVLAVQGQVRDLRIRANPRINSLVMEGDPSSIQIAKRVLEELDVPQQQFRLQCMLLRSGSSAGPELPAELLAGLAELLPREDYALEGNSMLHGTVGSERRIHVSSFLDEKIAGVPLERYALEADASAFDAESQILTLSDFEFEFATPRLKPDPATATPVKPNPATFAAAEYDEQRLSTNLTLRRGEYTVVGMLGSGGSNQKLVVLRFEPIE